MSARRARSRTGSVSSSLGPASTASDVPPFSRKLAEGLFVLSPCCPLASRTESTSVVPDPARGVSCGGEQAIFSIGGVGFSWEPTGGLSRIDGVRRRWDR